MCGPPPEECNTVRVPRKPKKESDPFKGECRRCGANIENCDCWKEYEK